MPRKLTTGINTVRRRDKAGQVVRVDYYDRATGALLGHDRDEAIAKAQHGRQPAPQAPAASFAGLAAAYLASPEFAALAPRTKALNRMYVDALRERFGDLPSAAITPPVVRALRDRYVDQPVKGNRMVSTLRLVLGYGVRIGRLQNNAAARPGRLRERPRTEVWSPEQIERFMAAAPPAILRAAALMLYTAQRPADVLAMTTGQIADRDGRSWITLRQAKTRELVEVPLHARAARILAEHPPPGLLLVPAPRGGAWAYRNFCRAWDACARRADRLLARERIASWPSAAGRDAATTARLKESLRADLLAGLQRRDLRRTAMVRMAEAGATTAQIAAVSGHTIEQTTRILDTYIPRRGAVALGAIAAWEDAGSVGRVIRGAFSHSVAPQSATRSGRASSKTLK